MSHLQPSNVAILDVNADGLPDIIQPAMAAPPASGYTAGSQGLFINAPNPLPGNLTYANILPDTGSLDVSDMATDLMSQGDYPSVYSPYGRSLVGDWLANGGISVVWSGHPHPDNSPSDTLLFSPQKIAINWVWRSTNIHDGSGALTIGIPPFRGTNGETTTTTDDPAIDDPSVPIRVLAGDINGDGLTDSIELTSTWDVYFRGANAPYKIAPRLSARKMPNQISPFQASPPHTFLTPYPSSFLPEQLVDVNGDGIDDLFGNGTILYGDGYGNFGCANGTTCTAVVHGPSGTINVVDGATWNPIRDESLPVAETGLSALHDLDGDGIADYIVYSDDGIQVFAGIDGSGQFDSTPILTITADGISEMSQGQERWRVYDDDGPLDTSFPGVHPRFYYPSMTVLFADMNGTGTDDLVLVGAQRAWFFELQETTTLLNQLPGLMTLITNSRGATTSISYMSTTAMNATFTSVNAGWATTSPQIEHVAYQIVSQTNAGGAANQQFSTIYNYFDPAYDAWRRQFVGFRRVTRVESSGVGNNPVATTTTFLIHTCQDVSPCTTNSDVDLVMSMPPLPIVESVYGALGAPALKLTHWQYHVDTLAGGPDGRAVRFPYLSQTDTYSYDEAGQQAGQGVAISAHFTDLDWSGGSIGEDIQVESSATGPFAHLRTTSVRDSWGNVTTATDYGEVDPLPDPPIVTTFVMQTPDRGLIASATVAPYPHIGGAPDNQPRTRTYQYDAAGNVTYVWGILSGTLPLDRFGASSVAPAPTDASHDGTIQLRHFVYDSNLGAVTREEGAYGTCTTFAYGGLYADLPDTTIVSPSGTTCGTSGLVTQVDYDQGFQAPTLILGNNGSVRAMTYDGFGRPITMTDTDPSLPNMLSSQAGLTIGYTFGGTFNSQLITHTRDSLGRETYSYQDGFDDTILTLQSADASDGSTGAWLASGAPVFGVLGLPEWISQPWFFSGDQTNAYPAAETARNGQSGLALKHFEYDDFGRLKKVTDFDGTVILQKAYHALAVDTTDASGLVTTTSYDGHGRVISVATKSPGDTITNFYVYQATGEISVVARTHSAGTDTYERWMQYDSLGRMVRNVEPNTSTSYNNDPASFTGHSWRYAYNNASDLVGTSDARGCGENIAYDAIHRPLREDYSPCLPSPTQLSYTSTPEVTYFYDTPEGAETSVDYGVDPSALVGRLAAVNDRSADTRFAYDMRGRHIGMARNLAKPASVSGPTYTGTWYRKAAVYDDGAQLRKETTGLDAAALLGAVDSDTGNRSTVAYGYSMRGLLTSVGGSYGNIISKITYDNDALPLTTTYGDIATTTATAQYYPNQTLHTLLIQRGTSPTWGQSYGNVPPADWTTTQTTLADLSIDYNVVQQPGTVHDQRVATAWPAGTKPSTHTFSYDSLHRLTELDYSSGTDSRVSPFAAEECTSGQGCAISSAPVPSKALSARVGRQTFTYDFMGNTTSSGDDTAGGAGTFFDRSLGTIVNGDGSGGHQNQMRSFDGFSSPQVTYDAAGNVVNLVINRTGTCSAPTNDCVQRYVYDWDEVGQLARARRWDYATLPSNDPTYPAVPSSRPAWDISYSYDSSGRRVITAVTDTTLAVRYRAEIFDTLRLDNAMWNTVLLGTSDYVHDSTTEVGYLAGIARVVNVSGVPSPHGSQHVFIEVGDRLGSTSSIIDRDTSELVEQVAYTAFGGTDADYRPARWNAFREHYRYTGKEDDIQVGLTYFGARYYAPNLGRWLSADPLTIHGLAADLNPYAFVRGTPSSAVDANGLTDEGDFGTPADGSSTPPPGGAPSGGSPGSSTTNPHGGGGGRPPTCETATGCGIQAPQPPKRLTALSADLYAAPAVGGTGPAAFQGFESSVFQPPSWATPFGPATFPMSLSHTIYDPVLNPYGTAAAFGAGVWNGLVGVIPVLRLPVPSFSRWRSYDAGADAGEATVMAVSLPFLVEDAAQLVTRFTAGYELAEGAAQGASFSSYGAYKRALGSAGDGFEWHHIVEQNPTNMSRFGAGPIQNTGNIIRLDVGTHRKVSAFYSSIQPQVTGSFNLTVREWASTQSFARQQEFGMDVLSAFGVTW